LVLVRSYRNQQSHEVGFKKTAEEPPRTLEKIKAYLASQFGVTGATLYYVVHPDIAVKPEAEDPAEGYDNVDQEMTARASYTGRSFLDDRHKVWDIMSNICVKHSCFVYIKPDVRTKNGRDGYMLLFTISFGPTMWGIWPVKQRPSSLAPSTTVKRSVSPGKLISGVILNNIQSSIDLNTMDMPVFMTLQKSVTYLRELRQQNLMFARHR
jgi:hypothetical protein